MIQLIKSLLLGIFILFSLGISFGQSNSKTPSGHSELLHAFDSLLRSDDLKLKDSSSGVLNMQNLDSILSSNDNIKKEYNEFWLQHIKKVYSWQHYSSITIFIVVMIIVITGLVLSILHFRQDLLNKTSVSNELEIGKSGIKIKSSIIGIIIMILSITFLYLYLTHVYRIE